MTNRKTTHHIVALFVAQLVTLVQQDGAFLADQLAEATVVYGMRVFVLATGVLIIGGIIGDNLSLGKLRLSDLLVRVLVRITIHAIHAVRTLRVLKPDTTAGRADIVHVDGAVVADHLPPETGRVSIE